jgi:hypothetical protein
MFISVSFVVKTMSLYSQYLKMMPVNSKFFHKHPYCIHESLPSLETISYSSGTFSHFGKRFIFSIQVSSLLALTTSTNNIPPTPSNIVKLSSPSS